MRFCSLASGSSGNATVLEARHGSSQTRVLVDCGMSRRQLARAMARIDLTPADLDAIFITHEHSDHVGSAVMLAAERSIPLWASNGTRTSIAVNRPDFDWRRATDGVAITIGAIELQPFTVPHDAREPLQLTCTSGARRLGILTDLGHITPHVLKHMAGCHVMMLESNHDTQLLESSRYPSFLKQRISGPLGHLSNSQAAAALTQLVHEGLHTVVAAHLSESNNTSRLVQENFSAVLEGHKTNIRMANPVGLPWIVV